MVSQYSLNLHTLIPYLHGILSSALKQYLYLFKFRISYNSADPLFLFFWNSSRIYEAVYLFQQYYSFLDCDCF